MRRREFIAGLGGAAVWPIASHTQQQALPVIGFLSNVSPEGLANGLTAFRQGLGETDYIEGRNVTIEYCSAAAKQLQLVREVAPSARTMAALVDGNDPNGGNVTSDLQAAARILGVHLDVFYAGNDRELEEVFTKLSQARPGGLVISTNVFLPQRFEQLTDFTIRHSIPTIGPLPFVKAGGLISLGATDNFWRVIGVYTGRILKGDRPGDLPVQRATKFTLAINMNTAKTLGVTFPTSILVAADEVIE